MTEQTIRTVLGFAILGNGICAIVAVVSLVRSILRTLQARRDRKFAEAMRRAGITI